MRDRKGRKMCIKSEEVALLLQPLKDDIISVKDSVAHITKMQVDHVKLEGQVLHLQKSQDVMLRGEDKMFTRLRAVEVETRPREGCSQVFKNINDGLHENRETIKTLAKTINDRTWAMVIALLGMWITFVTGFFVTVVGGTLVYYMTRTPIH